MCKALAPIPIAMLLGALVFSGCTTAPNAAKASRSAVARSNEEAKRLYHAEPFKLEHGQLRTERNRLVWDALTSSSGHDFVARVALNEKGSVVSVDVRMIAPPHWEPPALLDHPRGLDKPNKERPGIPEVVPK
jgi:hypothetical protein